MLQEIYSLHDSWFLTVDKKLLSPIFNDNFPSLGHVEGLKQEFSRKQLPFSSSQTTFTELCYIHLLLSASNLRNHLPTIFDRGPCSLLVLTKALPS